MLKKIFLSFIFFSLFLQADILDNKIKNIIGERRYLINKNLINLIFKHKEQFILNDKINYYKLFTKLKKNGLLQLKLSKPQDINIEFDITNKGFKAYKILNDTMGSLGYGYFFTKSLKKQNNELIWKIVFRAEYMVDSGILIKELQKNSCKILDVKNLSKNSWYYKIDVDNAILSNAIKVDNNEKVKFQKPLNAYMIKVNDAKKMSIYSRKLNNWFPSLVFFDKDLKVLKVIKKNRVYRKYHINLPKNTAYIKITDLFNLINIKRGLTVVVQ